MVVGYYDTIWNSFHLSVFVKAPYLMCLNLLEQSNCCNLCKDEYIVQNDMHGKDDKTLFFSSVFQYFFNGR